MSIIFTCVLRQSPVYGVEQVNRLYEQIAQNLSEGVRAKFLCFTDATEGFLPGIQTVPLPNDAATNGWWAKLYMFSHTFGEENQVFYFDLDTIITGLLDNLVTYRGKFAILQDFYRRARGCYNSGLMSWNGSFGPDEIWKPWVDAGCPHVDGGDQVWIEQTYKDADILQDHFPGAFLSFKGNCYHGLPQDSVVVGFHGHPKPWSNDYAWRQQDEWVHMIYREGKRLTSSIKLIMNAPIKRIQDNIKANSARGLYWVKQSQPHNMEIALVGGGPSVKDDLETIKGMHEHGVRIVALNNSARWLQDNGVTPDAHVILDARESNVEFVKGSQAKSFMFASQVDPRAYDIALAKGVPVSLYHTYHENIEELFPDNYPEHCLICAGSTVGNTAIGLMHALGYRRIHLFGYDSSIAETGDHHVYEQKENDNLNTSIAHVNGRQFVTQNWMASQATEFYRMAPMLAREGTQIIVHGDGLLPELAKTLEGHPDNERCSVVNGWWYPKGDTVYRRVINKDLRGLDHIMELIPGRNTVVQAGGCIGAWPKRLASEFANVHTFEPDEVNLYCMQRNIGDAQGVHVYGCALGAKEGMASLTRSESNAGGHCIKEGDEFFVKTIDSLSLSVCDAILLDLEGYELNALEGAVETIKRCKPVLVVEDQGMGSKYGAEPGDLEKFMDAFGYERSARVNLDTVYTPRVTVETEAALETEGA